MAIGFSRLAEDADLAEGTARRLLARFGGIQRLADISPQDLMETSGIEGYDALRCQALIELGRRSASSSKGPVNVIECPEEAFAAVEHLRHEKREHFVTLLLDAKNQVMRLAPIHIGTLTQSLVGPREVFREAIRDSASSMIVAHNHPSGDPTPSPEDIEVTQRLVDIGALLDIPVLDHIIVGERRFTSFSRSRIMPKARALAPTESQEDRHTSYRV
jgi:DNA repair protein RadC